MLVFEYYCYQLGDKLEYGGFPIPSNVRKGLFINVLMALSSVLAMAIVGYDDGE